MARARNIKPALYKNEDLAECSLFARLLFPGLWMLADREGRIEDRPKRIKGELFAYDSVEVDPLLDELQTWGFIERYVSDGKRVISICKFLEHQSPHGKESDSEFPDKHGVYKVHERNDKNGCVTGEFKTKYNNDTGTVQVPCNNDTGTVQAHPESLIPHPESLILNPEERAEKSAPPEIKEKFNKPTKTDIHDFCEAEGIFIDADKFIDHYAANGWVVGKVKMKDWKATARNWARREQEFKQTAKTKTASPRDRPAYRLADDDFKEIAVNGERIQ